MQVMILPLYCFGEVLNANLHAVDLRVERMEPLDKLGSFVTLQVTQFSQAANLTPQVGPVALHAVELVVKSCQFLTFILDVVGS